MKLQGVRVAALLMAAGLAMGCARLPTRPANSSVTAPVLAAPSRDEAKIQLRNNAASLLRDLLEDEKNVGKVFLIKRGPDVEPLVKLIAAAAENDERQLDQMAQADLTLNLHAVALPAGEKAAREATAKSKEHDLLFSSGANFEFNLLLTQAEAENYGWHLAKVAAEACADEQQAKTLTTIAETMRHLYEQAIEEMRKLPGQ